MSFAASGLGVFSSLYAPVVIPQESRGIKIKEQILRNDSGILTKISVRGGLIYIINHNFVMIRSTSDITNFYEAKVLTMLVFPLFRNLFIIRAILLHPL